MKPLKIQPYLQINIAALVVLGTLLLGMGQRGIFYPLFALVVAVLSVTFVDFKRTFSLDQNWSRVCAMGVVFWLLFQMVRNVEQSQLLNVANVLVFLQAILLFQRKTNRIYWELISLSMLQVAVAAALNLGFMFGVMLIVYVLAGILALALFYVYREIRSLDSPSQNPTSQLGQLNWYHHDDVSGFVIEQSFLGRLGWLACMSVLGTILLFFSIPRLDNQGWRSQQAEQITTVGFSEQVELDDIGEILENPEEVMRVEFTHLDRQPFAFTGEPYFRGTVLTEFRSGREIWRQQHYPEDRVEFERVRCRDLTSVVVQKTTLQPGRHRVLFNIAPCYTLSDRPHPRFLLNFHTRQLIFAKERNSHKGPVRYEIGTTAFRNQTQSSWIPILNKKLLRRGTVEEPTSNRHRRRLLMPFGQTVFINSLLPLQDLATSLLTDAGLQGTSAVERAKYLERYFLNSDEFNYSLKGPRNRNRRVPAIVDFVVGHKTGHCEFFASALALMLRSQGIPSRLVIGYKGGDYNGVGNFFTVRQLHCHAWVEAYIPPEEVPTDAIAQHEERGNGAWMRLDPTPSRSQIVTGGEKVSLFTKMKEMIDYCQVLWDDYVLGLNSARQRQSIYQPLTATAQDVAIFLFGKQIWESRLQWLQRQAHGFITGRWITWQSIVLLAILAPLVYMVRAQLRWLLAKLLSFLPTRRRRVKRTKRGEMIYDRLETVLSRNGYKRSLKQTQHDFATVVMDDLACLGVSSEIIQIPREIATAFYRVRFGNQTLSDTEFKQLEKSLHQFERGLPRKSKNGSFTKTAATKSDNQDVRDTIE